MNEIKVKYIIEIDDKRYDLFFTLNQLIATPHFVDLIQYELETKHNFEKYTAADYKVMAICQLIGIKDKNEIDIYENDKVSFSYYESNKQRARYELIKDEGIVKFISWLGAWCILYGDDNYIQIKTGSVQFRVIGNEFEGD